MTFKTLLKRLQKPYGSVRAFAQALGIHDPSRISRGKPFDVLGCLRLAQVTGTNPGIVLRAANKGDIATMIETLYGPGKALLTADQQTLLEALEAIREPYYRQVLIAVARGLAGMGTAEGGSSSEGGNGPMIPPSGTPPDYKMAHVFARRARSR